jgi:ABC-type transport system involved in multi-copper enzyme maturation permease subunit
VALTGILAATFNTPGSLWPALVHLMAIITGAALIGPEFSTSTLQLIVSKPIRRSVYLVSRVTGVFASVTLAAIVGLGAEIATRFLLRGGDVPWPHLGAASAILLTSSLLTIALLAMLGSVSRSYLNVAIYLGAEAGFTVLESLLGIVRMRGGAGAFLEQHPAIERGIMTVDDTLFPAAPPALASAWFARVLLTAAIAIVLACAAFERREVPYGGD